MPDPRRHTRRYLVRLMAAIAAYAVLLPVALLLAPRVPAPWDLVVVLLPTPALVAVAWAVWRYLREVDEMLRRQVVESLALGFGLGSIATFGYGLLQFAGAPPAPWILVWAVYGAAWLMAAVVVRLRNR